jgi:ABC-type branched-subunit amino acid transport system substrate-binding protein
MKETRKLINSILIVLMMSLVSEVACQRDATPYEIGIVLPLSGEGRAHSMDVMKGIEIGFEEINTIRGVRGKELKAVYLDATQDEKLLTSKLEEMLAQRIVIFIVAEKRAVELLCSLSKGNSTVIFTDWKTMVEVNAHTLYAITPQPYTEGRLLGSLALGELKSTRAFLLSVPADMRSVSFARGFEQEYHTEGGRALNSMHYEEHGAQQPSIELIKSFNVDLVVVATYSEPSAIVRKIRDSGFEGTILLSTVAGEMLQREADLDTFAGIYYATSDFSPDSKQHIVRDFQERFMRRFKKKADYTASVHYDLAEIIAYVLEINGDDVRRIHKFLGKVRDYNAITGRTSYYPDGEVEKPIRLEQIW